MTDFLRMQNPSAWQRRASAMTIAKAIEALELGLSEENADGPFERMRQALTALRSLPGPATEEEMTLALRDRVDSAVKAWERKVWRLAERRLLGE